MKMDEYELDLLEAVENATEYERVENFEEGLMEAKMAAKNFLKKTKNKFTLSVYLQKLS